jgi:hypothetical protein
VPDEFAAASGRAPEAARQPVRTIRQFCSTAVSARRVVGTVTVTTLFSSPSTRGGTGMSRSAPTPPCWSAATMSQAASASGALKTSKVKRTVVSLVASIVRGVNPSRSGFYLA